MVGITALYPPVLLISISNAEAVLRDHLYNVDVLINRALVYASLTFVLAQSISEVTSPEAIFRPLTAQEERSRLAVVATTLVNEAWARRLACACGRQHTASS